MIAVAVAVLSLPGAAHAQDTLEDYLARTGDEVNKIPDQAAFEAYAVGDSVSPRTTVPLRLSPPGIFFQGKGDMIGTLDPDEELRIVEQKVVPTLLGRQIWFRVEDVDQQSLNGWVYQGPADGLVNNLQKLQLEFE